MKKKTRRLIQIIALVLVILLAGGAVVSAVFTIAANAEEVLTARSVETNEISLEIEYLENEQALRITQRVLYINRTGKDLDRIVFYAVPNMFRRLSAVMYEDDRLSEVFPQGFVPGGIELKTVSVRGVQADWGYQGTEELFLSVMCDLAADQSCEILFEYYLLLTQNRSFLGIGEKDIRLTDFCFIPAAYDTQFDEYICNKPLAYTHYIDTELATYTCRIALPESMQVVSTGQCIVSEVSNGIKTWSITAECVREFGLCVTKEYGEVSVQTDSGIMIRCFASRSSSKALVGYLKEAIGICEQWFGTFPSKCISIVETEYAFSAINTNGCILLGKEATEKGNTEDLRMEIFSAVAQQYFGLSAYARPVRDAWLSDTVSDYVAYMILEESDGHDAYLKRLNKKVVPSLQLTVPGGLMITSNADIFTEYEYDIIVRDRGVAVFHELCTAMGRENLLNGLKCFYEKRLEKSALTEMDFVDALNKASGKSWEAFLTDWLFNVGDYVNQQIEWLD